MSETLRRHHIRRGITPVRTHVMRTQEGAAMNDYLQRDPDDEMVLMRMSPAQRQLDAQLDRARTEQADKIRSDTMRLNRILAEQREREIPTGAR